MRGEIKGQGGHVLSGGIGAQDNNATVLSWRYLWIKWCINMSKRARKERGNTRGGATKKCKISSTLLSRNLHFLVHDYRVTRLAVDINTDYQ